MTVDSVAMTGCDTTDMVVLHRVFRREFGLMPRLVRSVPPHDVTRASLVAAHARELATALHHHHQGEDELLWPVLSERAEFDTTVIERMELQHARVALLLDRITRLLPGWGRQADVESRASLAGLSAELSVCLNQHLDEEEREILPVVQRHLSTPEWAALGRRGMASIPRSRLLVFLGHILEEASPTERTLFLAHVPPPGRLAYRLFGERRYHREVEMLRGPLTLGA